MRLLPFLMNSRTLLAEMQQLILGILVICNVGAGIELAADLEDVFLQSNLISQADAVLVPPPDGNPDGDSAVGCDHCCHGIAHLAGMIVHSRMIPYQAGHTQFALAVKRYWLPPTAPPNPPPNV